MTRAVDGLPVLAEEELKESFLEDLERVRRRSPFTLHAYCLMTTHIHLVLSPVDVEVARIMHDLLSRFAMRFNRRMGRKGHVFQSRYTERVCLDDVYFMTLLRYVHLNPVKAGMVLKAEDWPWSSHVDYLGWRKSGIVDASFGLALFNPDCLRARALYRHFIEQPGEPFDPGEIPAARSLDVAPMTIEREPRQAQSLGEIVSRLLEGTDLSETLLRGPSRKREIAAFRRRFVAEAVQLGHQQVEVARFLGRSTAWVSMVDEC
ncbi:MAG: transposase [Elusimicrobia bacterium]|nr:transposase [Elusimicrobiota bacterium]